MQAKGLRPRIAMGAGHGGGAVEFPPSDAHGEHGDGRGRKGYARPRKWPGITAVASNARTIIRGIATRNNGK